MQLGAFGAVPGRPRSRPERHPPGGAGPGLRGRPSPSRHRGRSSARARHPRRRPTCWPTA